MRGTKRTLAIAVSLLLVIVSCSTEADSESGSSPADEITPGPLPISAMLAEYGNLMSLLTPRIEEEVRVCMAREGFEYIPEPSETWEGWTTRTPSAPFLPLSVERASEVGYSLESEESLPPDPFRGPESQREEFSHALVGGPDDAVSLENGMTVNTGGCLGEARAAIADGIDESVEWLGYSGVLVGLSNEAYQRAEESSEWSTALDEWLRCLNDRSYEVESLEHAVEVALVGSEDLTEAPIGQEPAEGAERPTAREIEVAVADAQCRADTDLEGTWARQISIAEQIVIADRPEAVLGWVAVADDMRDLVADILEDAPNPEDDPATEYTVPDESPSTGP